MPSTVPSFSTDPARPDAEPAFAEQADRWMTAAEVAAHFGLSRATIYNLLAVGLPSRKIGRARRFHLPTVDAWLDAQS